jgi:FAD/FMN-containing dehydrogenase
VPVGTSWGRWPRHSQQVVALRDRFHALPEATSLLPYGNGRSYGDVCLNGGGTLISTRSLDHMIAFDPDTGVLECEAGVLLREILDLVSPYGWSLAVVPGTALVTVGGAIANDVHGKNHHRVGTFCHHLLDFELLRSDGEVLTCAPDSNPELFRATIAGLGLTGLIRSARLKLRRIEGPWIEGDRQRFANIEEFLELSSASDADHEYTVAWIDSTASANRRGRGVFMRANHSSRTGSAPGKRRALRVAVTPPVSPLFYMSVRLLNTSYYRRAAAQPEQIRWHPQAFLFPLDRILDWNRLYGPRGFFQYQCALPEQDSADTLNEMLAVLARSRQGSFVSVLKKFGSRPSLGLMSFPRPGVTLALDFPNRGATTLQLLSALDVIKFFPAWREFQRHVDPHFSSSFWRRVIGS